jgi:hypothetical protein
VRCITSLFCRPPIVRRTELHALSGRQAGRQTGGQDCGYLTSCVDYPDVIERPLVRRIQTPNQHELHPITNRCNMPLVNLFFDFLHPIATLLFDSPTPTHTDHRRADAGYNNSIQISSPQPLHATRFVYVPLQLQSLRLSESHVLEHHSGHTPYLLVSIIFTHAIFTHPSPA